VGTGVTGQASTRYDFAAAFGIRGNVGNGYHAPTLAQDNFATTNVSPTSASAQLPVTSPGAKILGAPALTSEKSFDYGIGFISNPITNLHASIDGYSIRIDNRIIDTANFFGPLSLAAIEANGNVLPAGVPSSAFSAKFFTNGVNTQTRGVDLHADYDAYFGSEGVANFFTDANYNDTYILSVNAAPGALGAAGVSLVSPAVVSSLVSQTPKLKIAVGGKWLPNDRWEVTLRETFYGSAEGYIDPVGNGKNFYFSKVDPAYITDFTVKYNLSRHASVLVGATNLFDKEPTQTYPLARRNDGEYKYPVFSPFGIDGGYYFARVSYKL
jgi:iron complex outermembrane receptor protein